MLDGEEGRPRTTKLGWQLLDTQVDWDIFDEHAHFGGGHRNGGFKRSQWAGVSALIIPSRTVNVGTGLARLKRRKVAAA